MRELSELAKEHDRADIPVTIFSLSSHDPNLVERFATAGAHRYIFGISAAPAEHVLPILKRLSQMMRPVGSRQ